MGGHDSGWRSAGIALVSGVALAAAFEPWGWWWLAPAAVAGLCASVHRVPPVTAVLAGYLFGVAFTLVLTSWMTAIGVDAWLLVSLAVAIFYAALGWGISVLRSLPGWPLWVAAWWVTVETALSAWPLGGFPWTRLVWTVGDTPLAAWLPWVGSGAVSAMVALAGTGSCWVLARRRAGTVSALPGLSAVMVAVAGPTVLAFALWSPAVVEDRTATIALVQGDVPGDGEQVAANHREVTRNHVEATVELAARVDAGTSPEPDLVVWPENSTAVDPRADPAIRAGIDRAVNAIGVPVLIGAIVDGETSGTARNEGIVWTDTGPGDRYTKRNPVPFGEYVPMRGLLERLGGIGRLDRVPRDMVPGTRSLPLVMNGVRVGDVICFDVAYDDAVIEQVQNGAEVLTVQTSNATFINTYQPEQQFAISRIRARETGRSVVVASLNGISGVLGPDGKVVERLPVRTTAVSVTPVALSSGTTPAVRFGSWPALFLAAIGVAGLSRSATARSRAGKRRASRPLSS